ncbi:response regulator [Microbacterium lacus]|uniref:response regulator n=1 Tax=Microbacterium lacus TaxID=415217 RepID=UPI00384C26B3
MTAVSADLIRTLVVDDDESVRRLHEAYLVDVPGFVVVGSIGHGAGAAEIAGRSDIDLVLLDMNLPDFSGIEVLHRIRAARGSAVDVLVISSARDRVTVRQALSARIVGYLVKPFTQEAFTGRLTQYRDARAAAHAEADLPLGQGEIDRMLQPSAPASPAAPPPVSLAKGLSASTLDLVRAQLDPVRATTAAEIADAVGTSRATARRYLDHLQRTGEVDVAHRYGQRGRPELLYRFSPSV